MNATALPLEQLAMAALDALEWPTFAVTADGSLLMANRRGRDLLAQGKPFALRDERLQGRLYGTQEQLRRAIGLACQDRTSAFQAVQEGEAWFVRAIPMAGRPGCALVYLGRCLQPPVPQSTLRELLNLSEAQSDVALLLAGGRNVKQIAAARSVSVHTVRTQVREIFSRAGVRTQSALASLMTSIPKVNC